MHSFRAAQLYTVYSSRRQVKLPAQRTGLPGKVISFYTVPLPAYPALAGRGTFRSNIRKMAWPVKQKPGLAHPGDLGKSLSKPS
jgi:hypothetical protein